jgi:hypothetical protein
MAYVARPSLVSAVGKAGELILVEGYTDFASLYQAGVRNVVASLGTAGLSVDSDAHVLARAYIRAVARNLGVTRDVPAPDVYTTPQIMAWMMDTYSMQVGYSVPSIVTGKPIGLGGSLGRRESTGAAWLTWLTAPWTFWVWRRGRRRSRGRTSPWLQ